MHRVIQFSDIALVTASPKGQLFWESEGLHLVFKKQKRKYPTNARYCSENI